MFPIRLFCVCGLWVKIQEKNDSFLKFDDGIFVFLSEN